MPGDSPPPLDLRPVRFETQLGELTSPVVIEFEDTSLRVLTIRGRQGEMVKLLMSRAGATPEFLEAPSRLELGDLVVAHLTSRPVRAFWSQSVSRTSRAASSLTHWAVAGSKARS